MYLLLMICIVKEGSIRKKDVQNDNKYKNINFLSFSIDEALSFKDLIIQ